MVSSKEVGSELGREPPSALNFDAFKRWLEQKPLEWSVVIAVRAALRVLPLMDAEPQKLSALILPMFRAVAVAHLITKYGDYPCSLSARLARAFDHTNAANAIVARAAASAAVAADAVRRYAAPDTVGAYVANSVYAAVDSARVADPAYAAAYAAQSAAFATRGVAAAVRDDVDALMSGATEPKLLAGAPLWLANNPSSAAEKWRPFKIDLLTQGDHWSVWIDWYESILSIKPALSRDEDAAFTDVFNELPWDQGPEAVNTEIARRLGEISQKRMTPQVIPGQSPAPVRVEERDGKVAKASDRDSLLAASERDFHDWRDPVVEHVHELLTTDFAIGTNHSRLRERLLAFVKLLPGDIVDVKERQFRIGYAIERFEGLIAAYRSGGEDMPVLNAAQLEDISRLHVALKMGIDKLERWSEFRRQADERPEGDADPEIVADVLDQMAAEMERKPKFFEPELPASFRFLAEAARDRMGATKTVVYGAVKSAENLMSFLGRKAIGICKKTVNAVEEHISKAVAASLVAGLGAAALKLSGVLPQPWTWLKPLLTTIGAGALIP